MSQVTVEQLKDIMRRSAGDDDFAGTGDDILDSSFEDLGFDSLALLETAALLKREFGVAVHDDGLVGMDTPRILLDRVNAALSVA